MPEEVKAHILPYANDGWIPTTTATLMTALMACVWMLPNTYPWILEDMRKYVRSVNESFYLVGENWWTQWPDELMDAEPWVKGDVFDAVMHYQWYKPVRAYLNQGDDKISLEALYDALDSLYNKYRPSTQDAMMNLVSSHDAERALSAMFNTNKYKFHSKPAENPFYKTGRPDDLARAKMRALLFHQFTFKGAPHIWNGDEMGMGSR